MRRLSLLCAASLLMLPACSTPRVNGPMPRLQANLAARCPDLPPMPQNDPERADWEALVIGMYGDCGARHWWTVDAWRKARADQDAAK